MEITSSRHTYSENRPAEYCVLIQFCKYGAVPPKMATATAYGKATPTVRTLVAGLLGGQEPVHDHAHEDADACAGGAGDVDHGGPQTAVLRGSHFREVGLGGGHLAVGQTLDQAGDQQHDGREDTRGLERGGEPDHQGTQGDATGSWG